MTYQRQDITQPISATNRKRHELIGTTDYTFYKYYLSYLRRPLPIIINETGETFTIEGYSSAVNRDCELDPWAHQPIVDIAVNKLAASIKDTEKWQISQVETQKDSI